MQIGTYTTDENPLASIRRHQQVLGGRHRLIGLYIFRNGDKVFFMDDTKETVVNREWGPAPFDRPATETFDHFDIPAHLR